MDITRLRLGVAAGAVACGQGDRIRPGSVVGVGRVLLRRRSTITKGPDPAGRVSG